MKSLYEDLPEVEIGGRRLVGRVLFGLLVLISVLVGATAGLLLVYTTDLPQVDALEAMRPTQCRPGSTNWPGHFPGDRRAVVYWRGPGASSIHAGPTPTVIRV